MLNRFVVVYIDDILVYSKTYPEHVTHVQLVIHCLLAHGIYAKAEKCAFHKREIAFLGYRIGPDGVRMERSKVSAAINWAEPDTVKGLQ